jgi:hypothetical protein
VCTQKFKNLQTPFLVSVRRVMRSVVGRYYRRSSLVAVVIITTAAVVDSGAFSREKTALVASGRPCARPGSSRASLLARWLWAILSHLQQR